VGAGWTRSITDSACEFLPVVCAVQIQQHQKRNVMYKVFYMSKLLLFLGLAVGNAEARFKRINQILNG